MKKTFIYLAIATTFLTNCAQKEPYNVNPINIFPNSNGSSFTYLVVDSIKNKTYNVQVNITGDSKLANGISTKIWTFSYPDHVDTNYVTSNLDSIVFYNSNKIDINNIYHLPLHIGDKWRQSFISDSCYVINNSTMNTPAGTFSNAFLIEEKGHSPNYVVKKDLLFVQNIGLIKQSIYERNLGSIISQSWVLIKYNLSN